MNAGLDGEELYIQTNLGYFKRSLGATSPFISVSKAEAQPCFRIEKEPAPTVKKLFRDTEAVGVFADAEHVYPAGDNLYWLSIENEAGLFHVADGIGTLKCRLLFDNYNMNLVTRGKRIIPLNDSLVLVSAMQGTLLVNIRELIGNSLGSTPESFGTRIRRCFRYPSLADQHATHFSPAQLPGVQCLGRHHDIHLQPPDQLQDRRRIFRLVSLATRRENHFPAIAGRRYELKVRKYVIKGPYPELTLPIEVRPPGIIPYGHGWSISHSSGFSCRPCSATT